MKLLNLAIGAVAGAAAGFAAGIILAPRSGAESRAMASDVINDAWDSAVDTYERGTQAVNDRLAGVRPDVDATADELRAKVDLARERMDQLRDSLANAVTAEDEAADEAVEVESEVEATDAAEEAEEAEEADAKVEVILEAAEAADEAEASTDEEDAE